MCCVFVGFAFFFVWGVKNQISNEKALKTKYVFIGFAFSKFCCLGRGEAGSKGGGVGGAAGCQRRAQRGRGLVEAQRGRGLVVTSDGRATPLYPPYSNWLGVSSVRGRNPDRRYPQTRRGQHSTIRKKGLANEPNPSHASCL